MDAGSLVLDYGFLFSVDAGVGLAGWYVDLQFLAEFDCGFVEWQGSGLRVEVELVAFRAAGETLEGVACQIGTEGAALGRLRAMNGAWAADLIAFMFRWNEFEKTEHLLDGYCLTQ